MFSFPAWGHRLCRGEMMTGLVRYVRERGKTPARVEWIGGTALLTVTLHEPEGLSPRRLAGRLERLERTLRRAEVSRVILPPGFPHAGRLRLVHPVDPMPFYRDAADVLLLGWLRAHKIPPGQGRVALAGPRLCPELRGAAERLCPVVREIRIDVPEGGTDYAAWLQRTWGLPVTPATAPVHVTAAFGPAAGAELMLYGDRPGLDGLRLTAEGVALPPELEEPLLALMWEGGRLDRGALRATNSAQTLVNGGKACYTN